MRDLLIIVGPTAVGKTGLSIRLAEEMGAEIISADSMQVYRGMDIGTAKPTPAERARVAHHLIDVADPADNFSAGDFLRLAEDAIAEITGRGKVPLVVGGTGLYVRALTDGLFEGPGADRALRESLLERERREGRGTLHAELTRCDPEAAGRIHPFDVRRIVRALEVFHKEGATMTERHEVHKETRKARPARVAGLRRARPELYARIERRVDAMMEAGLMDEVIALKERGITRGMVSMQALGYKQLMAHLEGEYTLDEAVRLIKRDSRRYAKRQFTWFNADPRVRWVDVTGDGEGAVLDALKKALEIFQDLR